MVYGAHELVQYIAQLMQVHCTRSIHFHEFALKVFVRGIRLIARCKAFIITRTVRQIANFLQRLVQELSPKYSLHSVFAYDNSVP